MKLILAAEPQYMDAITDIASTVVGQSGPVTILARRTWAACETSIRPDCADKARSAVAALRIHTRFDWALVPTRDRRKRLLVCDMDSTVVEQESLDELAGAVGCGGSVARLTEQAMRGGGHFAVSFAARLALLEGVSRKEVIAVRERLDLCPGASELVGTMKAKGARCILVSGGLDVFASHVAALCGFDRWYANEAVFAGDALSGRVAEPLLDASAKGDILRRERAALGLDADLTLAVGDGDNDRVMIADAGLGIAWRGSDGLKTLADCQIDRTGLTTALYFQGYCEDDIVPATAL